MEDIIGPVVSKASTKFGIDNAAYWTAGGVAAKKIVVGTSAEGMVFTWDGNGSPLAVQCENKLPVVRGAEGKVRVAWELAIRNPETDAIIIPSLTLYDKTGAPCGTIDLKDQRMPTADGKFRLAGITFVPPQGAAFVAPSLKFLGNRVKVIVRSIKVEPAAAKAMWLPKERQLRRVPCVRYEIDGAQPDEDTPVLTDEQLDHLLQRREKAMPELKRHADRMVLTVNGKQIDPIIHMGPLPGHHIGYFKELYKAGCPIATVTVKAGPKADTPLVPANIWLGAGKYDFEKVREAIRYVLKRTPDTYIMLHLQINVYNDWGIEHPGDVHVNVKGEKGICTWSRVARYGGPGPQGDEFWEASNHSKQFSNDASKMLKDLSAWLDSIPEGKSVIGAYLNGSADFQWLFSNEMEYADYSEGTLNAFREYLQEKYKSNANLSKAWKCEVTISTAGFPTILQRSKGLERSSFLSYNSESSQCADFNDFLSVSSTRRQIAFSKAFKAGSKGRFLTGCYWPTLPASYPLCHGDFIEMLNSKDVDFIARGGMLGAILHGKLPVQELDMRNLKSGVDAWVDYDDPYIAKSQGEFRRQVLAGMARELSAGAGFHLWDMWGGWFWHPQTMKIITEGLALRKYVKDVPSLGDNYVGVFVDEDAANHLLQLGRYQLQGAVEKTFMTMDLSPTLGGATGWRSTGLPVKFFLMQDALNPQLTIPKVAIFINPFTMKLDQANEIKSRFFNNGRCVVFMLAPGLAAKGDKNNPQKITGLPIKPDLRVIGKSLVVKDPSDSLMRGMRKESYLGVWTKAMEMEIFSNNFSVDKTGTGKVLAVYEGTDIPGMIVDRHREYTMAWIGSPGAVTPQMVRNFAKEAGLNPFIDNNNELIFGAGLLGVVGNTEGPQRVRVPENYRVEKCLTGHAYEVKYGMLSFTLGYGDMYKDVAIFSVSGTSANAGNK